MAGTSFRCKLVTPTAALMDDKVTYASVPAFDGLMGIQSGHSPMLIKLGLGELRVDIADDAKIGKGGSRSYLLDGGFMKIAANELTILAEKAIPAEELSAGDAETELRTLTDSKPKDGTTTAAAELAHAKDVARLKLRLAKGGKGI